MALRTPDTKERQDEAYNPGELHAAEQFPDAYASQGIDQLGAYANDPANRTKSEPKDTPTTNIDAAKEKEEDAGGWKNAFSRGGDKQKTTIKGFLKKKGPMGLIIGLLLGGGGLFSALTGPGLLIVNFKEKMNEKFNDQLAAMDIRTTSLIKKKFKGTTSGLCTSKFTVRCRYETMSKRQAAKLERAGVKINSTGETFLKGRIKIDSFEFEDPVTKKVTIVTAENFSAETRNNVNFRRAMMKGYNPKLAGYADALFSKLATKLGINKQKNITGDTEKERRKSVIDSANGTKVSETDAKVSSKEESCSGGDGCEDGKKTVYKDDTTGKNITKEQYDERISASSSISGELDARRELTEVGETATKATLKGALTSTALGLGAVDSACTGYTLIRTVAFAAKYLGALQLLRYAQVFMNTADSIKAGDADPEQVEFAGNILTKPNSEGHTATDSYGYKYAAYGDVSGMPRSDDISAEGIDGDRNNIELSEKDKEQILLNDETTKYINGQLVSDNLLTDVIGLVGESGATSEIDDFCGFVKSGWGQTILIGGAVVGAVAAFFSGGATLTWGAGAQIAVSVALSVAMSMLTPKLIDMAAGTMITGNENGNQAGNAGTSGMGAYNSQTAQARGLPAEQQEDAVAYQKLTEETIARYDELERSEHSPLDPTSTKTFMGSLVSRMVPYTTKLSSLSGGISAITQFTTSSFTSLIPTAAAQDEAAQYKVCGDRDYKELKLAVDPFCNIRYGLKESTLAIDPVTAADYMVDNDYVDETTGEPKDSENEYAEYIKNCMDRSVSIGGFVSEDDTNKGEECIQGNHSGDEEYKYNMFRLFYIDMSIDEGMENGYANSSAKAENENGEVVSPVSSGQTVTKGYGKSSDSWHASLKMTSSPSDVFASMAGAVAAIEDTSDGTSTIILRHADGLQTHYAHIKRKEVAVKVGDTVTAGQTIGKMEEYLEFGMWIDGVSDASKYSKYKVAPSEANISGKAINPANYLTDNGVEGYKEFVNDL